MKKRIIAFVAGTAALLAVAVGWQAFGASSGEEDKGPRPPATSTEAPAADTSVGSDVSEDAIVAPSAGSAEEEKSDDGERDGATDEHTGKPGEAPKD